ncbi:MAG: hypothetical protein AAGD96_24385, partial [Chloroflexota bacterium]
ILSAVNVAEPTIVKRQPAVKNFLRPQGAIDHKNYLDVIETGKRAYAFGFKEMTLDFSQVEEISSSGLFALYSLDLIFSGQEPPAAAGGYGALRQMVNHFQSVGESSSLHFENVSAAIKTIFEEAGISFA